ncbi:MAG: tail fiber domain-containing protein [Bacteriovorax sp.]|nr:tail fiber domain-containing protein [Bacteriovorax sp.]
MQKIIINTSPYHWRDSKRDKEEGEKLGFIAQEVEAIFPQAIKTDTSPKTLPGGTKMITYTDLIGPIVEAIKEFYTKWSGDSEALHRQVSILQAASNEKDRKIASQGEAIEELKNQNAEFKKWVCSKDNSSSLCKH